MHKQIPMVVTLVLTFACLAGAQDLPLPKSMPAFCIAELDEGGVIEITEAGPITVSEPQVYVVKVPVTKKVDGKIVTELREEKRTRIVKKTVVAERKTRVLIQACSFTNAAGAKLDNAAGMKQLAKPARAVVLRNGQKLDPFFADILRPETLVISIQQ